MPYIEDNLPYRVPYLIYVDPTNLCNFKCNFCPTGNKFLLKDISRPAGMMKTEIFEKFVGDLKKMITKYKKKPSSILLFKDGEPLMNPNLISMIKKVKENNLTEHMHITSNASRLNTKISKELINSGLDQIRFSIYGVDDNSYKQNGNNIKFDLIYNNIKEFWEINKEHSFPVEVVCKIIDCYTEKQISEFKKKFEKISSRLHIEKFHKWSDSDSWEIKNNDTYKKYKTEEEFLCAQPFSRLTVLFNGDVTPCCVDWSHKLVVGNIKDNSLDHIWNNLANKLRQEHIQNSFKKDSPCLTCDYKVTRSKFDKIYNKEKKLNQMFKI